MVGLAGIAAFGEMAAPAQPPDSRTGPRLNPPNANELADEPQPRLVTGAITSIEISGFGASSSELVLSVATEIGKTEPFTMEFDAVPQMFAAAVTMLVSALHARTDVQVVVPLNQPAGTPKISGVKILAPPKA